MFYSRQCLMMIMKVRCSYNQIIQNLVQVPLSRFRPAIKHILARSPFFKRDFPVLISSNYNQRDQKDQHPAINVNSSTFRLLSTSVTTFLSCNCRSLCLYTAVDRPICFYSHCYSFNSLHTIRMRNHESSKVFPVQKNLVSIPCRWYSDSKKQNFEKDVVSAEEKPLTIEKQLLNLMEMWKMNEAVKLLVESMKDGFTPNSGVILNLLQQLAHLGEVGNILELHDQFLKDKNITREDKFYALLTDAYRNSGRVEEGVALLRIIFHKTRDFNDVDPFFTMITIMIIRNFESYLYLMEGFVNDLMESDPPVESAVASLWKCLVLTEKFDQANALVGEHENLSKFIRAQMSNILYAPFYITYNKDVVLPWLMRLPQIRKSLWAAALEALIEHKCQNDKWQEALDCLREAMTDKEQTVKQTTLTLFLTNFLGQMSDSQVAELEEWAESLEGSDVPEIHCDKPKDKDL